MFFIILACSNTQQNSSKDTNEDATEILKPLTPPDSEDGFQFSFTTTVEPYTEIWKCGVYPAPYEELSPVNWIEYQVTEGLHHIVGRHKLPNMKDMPYHIKHLSHIAVLNKLLHILHN